MERLDLCIRLNYHMQDLEKEYRKLLNRIQKANLSYNEESLKCLGEMILNGAGQEIDHQEALRCLYGLFR